jgi:hypothetical protein
MTDDLHSITAYANDIHGNVGASETVYFTVEVPEAFSSVVISPIAVIVAIGVGILSARYFKKHHVNIITDNDKQPFQKN